MGTNKKKESIVFIFFPQILCLYFTQVNLNGNVSGIHITYNYKLNHANIIGEDFIENLKKFIHIL